MFLSTLLWDDNVMINSSKRSPRPRLELTAFPRPLTPATLFSPPKQVEGAEVAVRGEVYFCPPRPKVLLLLPGGCFDGARQHPSSRLSHYLHFPSCRHKTRSWARHPPTHPPIHPPAPSPTRRRHPRPGGDELQSRGPPPRRRRARPLRVVRADRRRLRGPPRPAEGDAAAGVRWGDGYGGG